MVPFYAYQTNMGTSSCKGQQTGVDCLQEVNGSLFAAISCHCSAMPQVVWEIEDPSEFRPDFKLGKEKGEFRVFDNVRSLDLRPAFPSLVVRDEKLAKEYICYGREGGQRCWKNYNRAIKLSSCFSDCAER